CLEKNDFWRRARSAELLPGVSRRESLTAVLPAFAVFALLAETPAQATVRRTSPAAWINRQNDIAAALARGEMTPLAWMTEVERLAADVDLAELMATVSRSRVTATGAPFHNDPQKRFVRFLDEQGEPRQLAYGAALFEFAPQNVVTPHGHKHMASAHMVVSGR